MAKVTPNTALTGIRGRIGNVIFKQYDYGIVATPVPKMPEGPPTPGQAVERKRMSRSSEFYHRVKADPVLWAEYQAVARKRPRLPVPAVVLRDFSTPPRVEAIHCSSYTGRIGDSITVETPRSQAFKIVGVRLTLRDAAGAMVEEGAASREGKQDWRYHGQRAHPRGEPLQVTATASDRPGHEVAMTVEWR